ncbi:flagellar hook-associated family protein [Flaviflagellibacter deserti]|uniref:Flagellin n=1 Tax=Flaviflagellibacter deserti TaxID=2267266 RepID=A0ABV9Z430_9HYPH
MKTTFISTQAVSSATRLSIMKMQAELAKNSKELGSGRWADVGLELGNKTGRTVSLRQDFARLDSIKDTNGLVMSRLDGSQAALEGMLKMAQDFSASLIGVRTGDTGADVIQDDAKNNLQALIASLNTSIDGEYLFAGIDTDVRPVTDYYATPVVPGTGPKAAVDDAFLTAFGMAQNDPAVINITPAAMDAFLNGAFAAMFDPAAWTDPTTGWSSASDQNVRSRISTSELVDTSANANEAAFRKIAMAYTMVTEFASSNLSEGAYQTVIDKAAEIVGEAISSTTVVMARLGTAQERVKNANDRMDVQMKILNTHINDLELVDPYEAQTRVTALETQLDMAYALTARAQQLSLLNYL